MLDIILEIIGQASVVGFILTLLARWIPDAKVYGLGVKVGHIITRFGSSRVPKWNSIENFFQNGVGQFFKGMEDGVDSDDPVEPEDHSKDQPRI